MLDNITDNSNKVLNAALAQNVTDVVLLGYDQQGELYIASASEKLDRVKEIIALATDKLKDAIQVED